MKVLFVCSSGGHLSQLLRLRGWWSDHERSWVTFDTPDAISALAGERVAWAHHPTTRNIPNAIRNLRLARTILRSQRPDVIISDGAGVAVPFFLLARLRRRRERIPTVYLEVYDRIDSPTLTGRLCRPLTSLFCVQWEEQLAFYPGAELIGRLF